jgi:hypothetical protein
MILALENLRQAWKRARYSPATKKAMAEYRKQHPRCEWDGCSEKVDVHHIVPVHVDPTLAADPENLISLGSARCHLCAGHGGDYQQWIDNVRLLCVAAQTGIHRERIVPRYKPEPEKPERRFTRAATEGMLK